MLISFFLLVISNIRTMMIRVGSLRAKGVSETEVFLHTDLSET